MFGIALNGRNTPNWLTMICGLITLIAGMVLFWGTEDLQKQLNAANNRNRQLVMELENRDNARFLQQMRDEGVQLVESNFIQVSPRFPKPDPISCSSSRRVESIQIDWRADGPAWVLNLTPEVKEALKGTFPFCTDPRIAALSS